MTHEEELIELLDKETTEQERGSCLSAEQLEQQNKIVKTFRQFGLQGRIKRVGGGPQVNWYDFTIEKGERLRSYQSIKYNIDASLGTRNVRMIQPMPERSECRLEVPKINPAYVNAGEAFRSDVWHYLKAQLPLMLGEDTEGGIAIMDLAKAPHLLIAGCTGTGKSVFIDSCLCSLMFKHTPDELKLILVDPKAVEFTRYENIPYLQFPVINSSKDVLMALRSRRAGHQGTE